VEEAVSDDVQPQTTAAAPYGTFGIPPDTIGLALCRIKGEELLMCEVVIFAGGASSVDTALRRASLAGPVGPVGETGDWWADIMSGPHSMAETIALSPEAWRSLKTHWMRCAYAR
jgi:hypothetical protein